MNTRITIHPDTSTGTGDARPPADTDQINTSGTGRRPAGTGRSGRRRGRKDGWVLTASVYTSLAIAGLVTGLITAALTRARARARGERRDEGGVLAEVALAVGMVLIAGAIVFALKSKATTMTNNICTNADPSTC